MIRKFAQSFSFAVAVAFVALALVALPFGAIVGGHFPAPGARPAFTLVPSAFAQQSQPIGPYGWLAWLTTNTATNTATISAQNMVGVLTGTPTAGATYTTDTATNLCALFPFVANQNVNNFGWDWTIKNTSAGANTITVAGGTGVTLIGTGTAAQNNLRHFKVVLTNCTAGSQAANLFSLETAAF